MTNMTPELLSPAGSLNSMRYAFAYGADAVYAGQPRYSLRVRNNEFTHENLVLGINEAHTQNKHFFVASNIIAPNNKVKTYLRDLEPVIAAGPDALIMSDPGLIMLVREQWPEMAIHLSVQSNVMNSAAVKFWHKQGIERVILSRELSLKEIETIRQDCPEVELETFVHGALCMAHSGRCLLSGYMNHRDPNQGACTNACRWQYKVKSATEDKHGNREPVATDTLVVEEAQRPGEYMAIDEDEHGTYIFNSKDLRAIQHIETLAHIGVNCFKIEGRTKTYFYTARTTQLYRQAIDDVIAGKPFNKELMDALEGFSTRGYTEGFYRRHAPEEYQEYENRTTVGATQQFVGEIVDYHPTTQMLEISVKNRFKIDDTIELMCPNQPRHQFQVTHIENTTNGSKMDVAPGSGYQVRIPCNVPVTDDLLRYGLLIRL